LDSDSSSVGDIAGGVTAQKPLRALGVVEAEKLFGKE
jgi:hypothetical protein